MLQIQGNKKFKGNHETNILMRTTFKDLKHQISYAENTNVPKVKEYLGWKNS